MTDDLAILQDHIDRRSNWGRWGPDDQLGTVNLITPDKIREAASFGEDRHEHLVDHAVRRERPAG